MENNLHNSCSSVRKNEKYSVSSSLFLISFHPVCSGQDKSYKPGEKASYTIQYGVITSGIGSLEVKSDTLDGKEVWHAKFFARTTGMADAIFKVMDIYEVYIDPDTELPVKSIRNIHEGRYTQIQCGNV